MAITELKPYLSNLANAIRDKTYFPNLFDKDNAKWLQKMNTGGSLDGATDTGRYIISSAASDTSGCAVAYSLGLASDYVGKTLVVSFVPTIYDADGVDVTDTYTTSETSFVIYSGNTTVEVIGSKTSGKHYAICTVGDGYINEEKLAIRLYADNITTDMKVEFNELMITISNTPKPYIPYGVEPDKINAQNFADKVSEVYNSGISSGKQSQYDEFWDNYQNNGNRTDYSYAFYGEGWNDTTFNPKYPLVITSANTMFALNNITELGVIDLSNARNFNGMFSTSKQLWKIEKVITAKGITNCTNMFRNCTGLTDITFEGVWDITGLTLQWSTGLTRESILSLIYILEDKSTDTSREWYITIGDENLAKLTLEEQNIAYNKGWVIY